MKITIIDGQGGKIGKSLVEQIKKGRPETVLYAIGTNRCNHFIVGNGENRLSQYILLAVDKLESLLAGQE